MQIPTEFKGTIYLYFNLKYGWIQASPNKWAEDEECILLGEVEVDVQFNDVRDKAVNAIDEHLKKTRAEMAHRIEILEGQKQSLLALEHKES